MSIRTRLRSALRRTVRSDGGLSMAEIIVALMVFSILATCVAYGLTNTLIQTQHSRARETAVALASQDLDSLRLRALNTKDGILQVTSTSAPLYQTVGKMKYGLERDVNWADTTGNLGACGTWNGTLAYKSVVDTISWRLGSGATQSVTMATSIAPISNLNTDTTGTIIVAVIGADGSAEPGLTVTMTPVSADAKPLAAAPPATDSDGCSFGRRVTPGTYKVTAQRSGGIDYQQKDPAINENVVVKAGQNTMVNFSYDSSAQFPLVYPVYPLGPAVSADMGVTFVNPIGAFPFKSNPVNAYPWQDGYSVMAGTYVGGTGKASCLSPNPAAWQTADKDGAVGIAPTPVATQPGTIAAATPVAMGTVNVTGLGGSDYITAVTSATAGTGDPGCSATMTLAFDPKFNKTASIALPYGTWTIYSGSAKGTKNKVVAAANLAVVGRGVVNTSGATANTVTLDPRRTVTP